MHNANLCPTIHEYFDFVCPDKRNSSGQTKDKQEHDERYTKIYRLTKGKPVFLSWNWSALLFGGLWLVSRKLYNAAIFSLMLDMVLYLWMVHTSFHLQIAMIFLIIRGLGAILADCYYQHKVKKWIKAGKYQHAGKDYNLIGLLLAGIFMAGAYTDIHNSFIEAKLDAFEAAIPIPSSQDVGKSLLENADARNQFLTSLTNAKQKSNAFFSKLNLGDLEQRILRHKENLANEEGRADMLVFLNFQHRHEAATLNEELSS